MDEKSIRFQHWSDINNFIKLLTKKSGSIMHCMWMEIDGKTSRPRATKNHNLHHITFFCNNTISVLANKKQRTFRFELHNCTLCRKNKIPCRYAKYACFGMRFIISWQNSLLTFNYTIDSLGKKTSNYPIVKQTVSDLSQINFEDSFN